MVSVCLGSGETLSIEFGTCWASPYMKARKSKKENMYFFELPKEYHFPMRAYQTGRMSLKSAERDCGSTV